MIIQSPTISSSYISSSLAAVYRTQPHRSYKKGRKADPNNYRPVSLTSAVCKMMERLVRDELENHLEKQGLLSPSQHGFRKGRSCCTQLLEVIHDWADILEESKPIDVIYLDYRKAFDSVPYERLLVKLHAHGIRGKGSVLGPILFLIYVNDLPEIVTSTVKLFADDTKIYRKIQNTHDSEELQRDLDKLMNWSQRWQLPFNMGKCSILHLGKNNPNHKYKLTSEGDIVELVEIEEEKDLGIKFDSLLSFKQHTSECVSKANQRIGLIRRNFQQLDNYMFLLLYKSLIRPLLEYGNTVWYPCYKQDSQELEKVQRRATKLVKNLRDMAYPARLRALDLPTLVYRRKRADMLQMYRIITGVDNLDSNNFVKMDPGVRTRGHRFKILKVRAETREKRSTLGYRAVNDWNALSNHVVEAENLIQFKIRLEKAWHHKEFKYDPSNFY